MGGVLSGRWAGFCVGDGRGFEWEMGGVLTRLMVDPCGMRILGVRARGFFEWVAGGVSAGFWLSTEVLGGVLAGVLAEVLAEVLTGLMVHVEREYWAYELGFVF